MKKLFYTFILIFALLTGLSLSANAAGNDALLSCPVGDSATVYSQSVEGKLCLFLPSSSSPENLTLNFSGGIGLLYRNGQQLIIRSGEAFDLTALYPAAPADGKYELVFSGNDGRAGEICIMFSENLRSLHITTGEGQKPQSYVDAEKGNKSKDGGIVLINAEGGCDYSGTLKEIKGRGNSTWHYPKKPYQFKLNESVDLLQTGIKSEKEKTWILLANYADSSLLRNRFTNALAAELGIEYTHNCENIDFYYDGIYCGSYLLSEKTEIGDGRVDIRDLEGDIEDANPEADFDELDTLVSTNSYGNAMQYVDGIVLPEDYSGGYLLEIDYPERARAEKSWFSTSGGQYVVSKSPEYLPAEAMEYISSFYQEFEDAVFNGGLHPTNGKSYTDYVDLESLAKNYLLLSFSQNGDAFLSSTYFYLPQGEMKLYAGPVWDYDTAYGLYFTDSDTGFVAARCELVLKLLAIDSFRDEVSRLWNESFRSMIADTLLGAEGSGSGELCSLADYAAQCLASSRMNALRWGGSSDYAASIDQLRSFLLESLGWYENEVISADRDWFGAYYADVHPSAWYASAVNYVSSQGYFAGVSDALFMPSNQMTRAMLVTVLHRVAGQPVADGSSSYADVKSGSWYSGAVAWAEQFGITTGYGNGLFGVNDSITREQLVVFLHRFALLSGQEITAAELPDSFADAADVSSWATEAFAWAISEGIIQGDNSSGIALLLPRATATRAQTAAMLQRYCQN